MQELLKYYVNLLIIQYNGLPKARETISLLTEVVLSDGLVFSIRDGFNIDEAVGVQLDIIGIYLDLDRFNNGLALNDSDYRQALKFRAVQNNSNHSTGSIDQSLFDFFGTDASMVDGLNMTITYFIPSVGADLITFLFEKNVFPRPMGVGIKNVIETGEYFSFAGAFETKGTVDTGFASKDDFMVKEGVFLGLDNLIV